MGGRVHDYPEQFAAGLKPKAVREKYYYARRPEITRVVDIGDFIDAKIAVNLLNTAQGPAGQNGAQLRRRLRDQGLRLPMLGDDNQTANREYVRQFVLDRDAEIAKKFGLKYAEPYHYIGPPADKVAEFVRSNAVRI